MKRRWIYAVEALVVGLWLTLLALGRPGGTPAEATFEGLSLLTTVESEDAEWFGVYLEGQKIGAAYSERLAVAEGWKLQERSYLKIRAFEQDKEVTTAITALLGRDGRLSSFTFYLAAPPVRTDVRGQVKDGALEVEIITGADVRRQTVPLPNGAPELSVTFKEKALEAARRGDDTLQVSYFDPASLSQQRMEVKIVGRGTAEVGGVNVDTVTLEAAFQGFTSRATMTLDGKTLSEESALGMTLKAEPRDVALYDGWGEGPPADIIALSVVPVEAPIPDPRATTRLHARLSGGGVETLLRDVYGGRSLKQLGEVLVEVPQPADWHPPQLPVVDPAFAPQLVATATVQKDDPEIARVARHVAGDDLRADLAARKLADFVHGHLAKVPTLGLPSAAEILKVGQGDCNEHTVLYTALARSVGLPTRMAAGIVYSDASYGGQGFFYHAWPEVWLGGWVPIDPTFGEFPADATHIKLVEGDLDQQIGLVRVVGKLRIEILEIQ